MTGPFEAGDEILAFGIWAKQLTCNGVRIRYLLEVLSNRRFISRRIGGVDLPPDRSDTGAFGQEETGYRQPPQWPRGGARRTNAALTQMLSRASI